MSDNGQIFDTDLKSIDTTIEAPAAKTPRVKEVGNRKGIYKKKSVSVMDKLQSNSAALKKIDQQTRNAFSIGNASTAIVPPKQPKSVLPVLIGPKTSSAKLSLTQTTLLGALSAQAETMSLNTSNQSSILARMEHFQNSFLKGYLKKSLTLKYQHTLIAKDTYSFLNTLGNMLEQKLEAIKLNTAAPDQEKLSFIQELGRHIRTSIIKGIGKPIETFFANKIVPGAVGYIGHKINQTETGKAFVDLGKEGFKSASDFFKGVSPSKTEDSKTSENLKPGVNETKPESSTTQNTVEEGSITSPLSETIKAGLGKENKECCEQSFDELQQFRKAFVDWTNVYNKNSIDILAALNNTRIVGGTSSSGRKRNVPTDQETYHAPPYEEHKEHKTYTTSDAFGDTLNASAYTAKGAAKAAGSVLGGIAKMELRAARAVVRSIKVSPFTDVYRKGEISPKDVLITAKQLKRGLRLADGTLIKNVNQITQPVIDPLTGQILIGIDDIDAGLVDAHGRSITSGINILSAGASAIRGGIAASRMVGKVGRILKGPAATVYGGILKGGYQATKGTAKVAKNLLFGQPILDASGKKVGRTTNLAGLTAKGIGAAAGPLASFYGNLFGLGISGVKGAASLSKNALSRLFGFSNPSLSKTDVEDLVTKHLDKLYDLLNKKTKQNGGSPFVDGSQSTQHTYQQHSATGSTPGPSTPSSEVAAESGGLIGNLETGAEAAVSGSIAGGLLSSLKGKVLGAGKYIAKGGASLLKKSAVPLAALALRPGGEADKFFGLTTGRKNVENNAGREIDWLKRTLGFGKTAAVLDKNTKDNTTENMTPNGDGLKVTPASFGTSPTTTLGAVGATTKAGAISAGLTYGGNAAVSTLGKIGESVGLKTAARVVEEEGAKSILKKIPVVGLGIGTYNAVKRGLRGDYIGAAGELASGLISSVPVYGTAASVAVDAWLGYHDYANSPGTKLLEARLDVYGVKSNALTSVIRELEARVYDTFANGKQAMSAKEYVDYAVKFGFSDKDPKQLDYFNSWFKTRFIKGFLKYTETLGIFNIDAQHVDNLNMKQVAVIIQRYKRSTGDILSTYGTMTPDMAGYQTITKSGTPTAMPDTETASSKQNIMSKSLVQVAKEASQPKQQDMTKPTTPSNTQNTSSIDQMRPGTGEAIYKQDINTSTENMIPQEQTPVKSKDSLDRTPSTHDFVPPLGSGSTGMATDLSGDQTNVVKFPGAQKRQGIFGSSSGGISNDNRMPSTKEESVTDLVYRGQSPGKSSSADSSNIGMLSASYESGGKSDIVGYDGPGGTSYGKYQLSSGMGTYQAFVKYLKDKGGDQGKKIAEQLEAAGPGNTGSRHGAAVDAWKKIASDTNNGLGSLEDKFMKETQFDASVKKLPPELRDRINASPTLQKAYFSTVVQNGISGAASIFSKTYKPGATDADLITAAYTKRATQFGGQSPAVQASVAARLEKEKVAVLGMLKTETPPNTADGIQTADASSSDKPETTPQTNNSPRGVDTPIASQPQPAIQQTLAMLNDKDKDDVANSAANINLATAPYDTQQQEQQLSPSIPASVQTPFTQQPQMVPLVDHTHANALIGHSANMNQSLQSVVSLLSAAFGDRGSFNDMHDTLKKGLAQPPSIIMPPMPAIPQPQNNQNERNHIGISVKKKRHARYQA